MKKQIEILSLKEAFAEAILSDTDNASTVLQAISNEEDEQEKIDIMVTFILDCPNIAELNEKEKEFLQLELHEIYFISTWNNEYIKTV